MQCSCTPWRHRAYLRTSTELRHRGRIPGSFMSSPNNARVAAAFGALVLAQAAHSTEECIGRLWESFPPARFVAGLISSDLERGFIIGNVCLVAFGVWCYFWPVRRQWPVAT